MKKTLIIAIVALLAASILILTNTARRQGSKQSPTASQIHQVVELPERWIPAAAIAVLEIARPDRVLDVIFDPALADRFAPMAQSSGPAKWRQAIGTWIFRRHFESKFGADWKTLLRRLTAGGAIVGLGPDKTWVAVAKGDDARFVADIHDEIIAVARRGNRPDPGKISEARHGDTAVYSLNGGKTFHAVADGHLILSNKMIGMEAVLDARSGKGGPSIMDLAGFKAAKGQSGGQAVAELFVSSAAMRNLPTGRVKDNPLAALVLGAYADALDGESWTAVELDLPDGHLALRLQGPGKPDKGGPKAFAWPVENEGALPTLDVPRKIAGLSLYRDLRHFYASKDALFPERTSQLIFFENMMGIFFSGRDIAEDVMGAVDPHIRLVVAEQDYDPAIGTPSVRLPAFALVFRMRDAARFGIIAEEAWQKMIGLTNFSRGQKAQPGLIIDRLDHGGIRYSCAYFSHAEEKDKKNLDARFNFRPSIACQGEFLIFSSTDGLANDLIDHLGNARQKPEAACNGLLDIECSRLASLVDANRESMIRDNMVKKGVSRAQAEKSVDAIPGIARFLGDAKLRMGTTDGRVVAELDFAFNSKDREGVVATANR